MGSREAVGRSELKQVGRRVTGLTNHQLNMVMEGMLQPTIDALIAHDIAEKMKGETTAA